MTRLATAIAVALVVLFAAAPAVALACGPDTGRDNSTVTLDQGVDQDGGSASTATAVIPRECVDPSRLRGAAGYVHAEGVPTLFTDPLGESTIAGAMRAAQSVAVNVGGRAAWAEVAAGGPAGLALGAGAYGANRWGDDIGMGVACLMGYCPAGGSGMDADTETLMRFNQCRSGVAFSQNWAWTRQSWCQALYAQAHPGFPSTTGSMSCVAPLGCSTRTHDASYPSRRGDNINWAKGGKQSGGPPQLSQAERNALARGDKRDPLYKSAKRKMDAAEKYAGQRDKKKRGTQNQ